MIVSKLWVRGPKVLVPCILFSCRWFINFFYIYNLSQLIVIFIFIEYMVEGQFNWFWVLHQFGSLLYNLCLTDECSFLCQNLSSLLKLLRKSLRILSGCLLIAWAWTTKAIHRLSDPMNWSLGFMSGLNLSWPGN